MKVNKLKAPIAVQIEVTENCNNLCKHCYNYWRYGGVNKFNSEEPDNLENIVSAVIKNDVFHIVFTGGEPLLKYESLLSCIQNATDNYVSSSLNSNLMLMDFEKAQNLRNAGLGGVLTSLFSINESLNNEQMTNPNAFRNILKGIEAVLNANFLVSVNMVVTKKNLDQVYALGDYVRNMGVQSFNATRFSPAVIEQTSEVLDKNDIFLMLNQLQQLKDEGYQVGTLNPIPHCFAEGKFVELTQNRGCSAGVTSGGIGVGGEVRACQHTDITYGNILKESLQNIWEKIPIWKEEYLPKECEGCISTQQCGGGCRHSAFILNGSYKEKDILFSGAKRKENVKKSTELIDNDEPIILYEDLKRRKEHFGGIIFRNLRQFALVDELLYELLPSVFGKFFTVRNISNNTEIPLERINEYFSYLKNRGLIYNKNGGKKNG